MSKERARALAQNYWLQDRGLIVHLRTEKSTIGRCLKVRFELCHSCFSRGMYLPWPHHLSKQRQMTSLLIPSSSINYFLQVFAG